MPLSTSFCRSALQGSSALHHAVREGHQGVVQLLLRCALRCTLSIGRGLGVPFSLGMQFLRYLDNTSTPPPCRAGTRPTPMCATSTRASMHPATGSGAPGRLGGSKVLVQRALESPYGQEVDGIGGTLLALLLSAAPICTCAAVASSCSHCTRRRCTWRQRRETLTWRSCC